MKPQYNTEELIKAIKRACSVPTSQLTYTDVDFVDIANDRLQSMVVPLMMSAREEYFVKYKDVASPADGVIPFPTDAVGAKLRSVCFVQQTSPLVLVNLPRLDLDVVAGVGFFNYATLAGFYIQGNDIILYPNTSVPVNSAMRLYYYKRSLALAAPENYGQITAIDTNTNTVQLNYLPVSWEVGTILNAVASEPNFLVTNESTEITSISSPSVVLTSVEGLSVGDYLSLEGYSAIPQIPVEAMKYLSQITAVACLEGLGDRPGMEAAQAIAEQYKTNLLIMVSQRVDGSVKKIMNPDGGLRLWTGWGRRGRGWSW